MKKLLQGAAMFALLSTFDLQLSPVHAQGTAFTYQGRLNDGAAPANGSYDVAFSLYATNMDGAIVAGPVTNTGVAVSNGLFTTTVNFGNVYGTGDRWLELAVSTNGANAFSTLSPRQALAPAPMALYAQSASNVLGTVSASQLSGSIPATNLSGTVSLAQLPAGIITNGASGVNITGTFTGDGAGVTNVNMLTVNSYGAVAYATNYGSFVTASSPEAGGFPSSVTSADVNGDGRPDLISANPLANTLTVLTNNGGGGFGLSSSLGVGNNPRSVTSADVNGDGRPDLISANFNANTLTVMTNNGSGGFVLSSSPGVGTTSIFVTSADVNGDGRPDLISANPGVNTLAVMTNNGGGGFGLSSSLGVGSNPRSVTSADVNGDGRPDLISANFNVNTLTVMTNNGSGGFVLSSSPGVGINPIFVTSADVNGDGRPDLISANPGDDTLTVMTNNGGGGFGLSSSPSVGTVPYSVTSADVNGDGRPDLISANYIAGTLTVLMNNGSGGFGLASSPSVDISPISVTSADVNGDGHPDLISANLDANTLTVLFNTASFSGRFTGDGSSLDGLDASKVTTGTISDARLSANVALLNDIQTFTGANTFSGNVTNTGTLVVSGTFLGSAPYLKFAEMKPVGTDGGANIAGTNNFRNFSEAIDTHNLGSTNSNGDIVLPAGTYQCRISAPGYRVNSHQIRLRTSTGTALLYGTTEYSDNVLSPSVQSRSVIEGQFTLAGSSTLQVQHFMSVVRTPNGLGVAAGAVWTDGNPVEVYAVAEFWKIK